jgi:hypothetical protein
MQKIDNISGIARSAGWFYMLNFAFGPGLYMLKKFVVLNDPAVTATNILAHTTLFHLGFAGNVIAVVGYLVVTALFYQLFKSVNQTVSLTAALLSATGCVLIAVGCAFYLAPLATLAGASGSAVLPAQTLALTFLKLYAQLYNTSLIFFSVYCGLIGYLAFKSNFIPRILGVGMMVAGVAWITFLWPPLARAVYPWMLIGGVGEMALALWLIVKGVRPIPD